MIGYVLVFVVGTLWYFACAAVYMLIARIIASVMGKSIPAGKLFRAAVYSKVFMFVISGVLGLLPLAAIPSLFRIILTTVFLVFAIRYVDEPEQPSNMGVYGGSIQ